MVRSGKLPAHIENVDPWGPTWIVNETDILRVLHPEQPLVEVIPPDYDTPMQIFRDVREGMTTMIDLIREGDQGIRNELQAQHEEWQTEMRTLRQEVQHLRNELAARQQRNWWPWKR